MSEIRNRTIEGLQVRDTFTVKRTFTELDVARFGDYNPIHYDDRFPAAKKMPGLICHGLLVASMITQVGGQIGWLASHFDLHFKKPVFFGDTITCRLTLLEISDTCWAKAKAVFTNQDGTEVLEAFLEGLLPGETEKEVLRAMVAEGDPTNKVP
jgi:3-hydroxybutyryl-CoA dehydratase